MMNVLLISTYELGRQPFGLASPAAWLRRSGAKVTCLDLSIQELQPEAVGAADRIAFHLPMHTATRKALQTLRKVQGINSSALVCFYGLYAPPNTELLLSSGADAILGVEFESDLVQWVMGESPLAQDRPSGLEHPEQRLQRTQTASSPDRIPKLRFLPPDRTTLPSLRRYASLIFPSGEQQVVGYTEASRGCKHLCRHCPVVPVYKGQFRIVQPTVVLADIAAQVDKGAQHITFGDPDFFNGIKHAIGIVQSLHQDFPDLTYDVTIKIEHLLQHSDRLSTLRETGCLFVTSAVESIDDSVLEILEKGHTFQDFITALQKLRAADLMLNPTFIPFTPWTTSQKYLQLLKFLETEDLVENVSPIQLAIRLLVPNGSRLLEESGHRQLFQDFDPQLLSYRWNHPDPLMDRLQLKLLRLISESEAQGEPRRAIFAKIVDLAGESPESFHTRHNDLDSAEACQPPWKRPTAAANPELIFEATPRKSRAAIPFLTEPWYC